MKPQDILHALSNLDPEDDDHWTADGQPRLDAIGNPSRAQVQAVAPLFNRANPELPEPPKPEPTLEEKEAALKAEKAAAEKELADAMAMQKAAAAAAKVAQDKVYAIERALLKVDQRTDVEINQEFLQADFNNRLEKAKQRDLASRLLAEAGVSGRDISMYKLGPADRAIAEANIRKRKEALKGQ